MNEISFHIEHRANGISYATVKDGDKDAGNFALPSEAAVLLAANLSADFEVIEEGEPVSAAAPEIDPAAAPEIDPAE